MAKQDSYFSTENQPPPHQKRTPRATGDWLRALMEQGYADVIGDIEDGRIRSAVVKAAISKNRKVRDIVALHAIVMATSFDRIVVERDGQDIEMASGADSLKASELLFNYYMGRPGKMERMVNAEGIDLNRNLLDVAADVYKKRLAEGEVSQYELSTIHKLMLTAKRDDAAIEMDKASLFLKAMGAKLAGLQDKQIAELAAKFEDDPQAFLGLEQAPESSTGSDKGLESEVHDGFDEGGET